MIKKFNILLIFLLFTSSKSQSFSPEIEQQIYIGCYSNSNQYIGVEDTQKQEGTLEMNIELAIRRAAS